MANVPFLAFEQDPFAAMRRLHEELNRTFTPADGAFAGGFPALNMWQGPESAALTAELPGVDPADIDISVKNDLVTINGERKSAADEDAVWHRRERAHGRFSRVIQLPYRVDPDHVEARMSDGVLQIELRRPEADRPRRVQINSN